MGGRGSGGGRSGGGGGTSSYSDKITAYKITDLKNKSYKYDDDAHDYERQAKGEQALAKRLKQQGKKKAAQDYEEYAKESFAKAKEAKANARKYMKEAKKLEKKNSQDNSKTSQAKVKKQNTSNLSKQIDTVSKKVTTLNEFRENHKFYNNLNNSDLAKAQKLTQKKLTKESTKYSQMLDEHMYKNYNIPKLPNKPFEYDTKSKEWKKYQAAEKAIEKQSLKVDSLSRSLKHANMIIDSRKKKT